MSKRSKFQAPRTIRDFESVQRAFREVQEALDATTTSRARLTLYTSDFALVAGSFHRVSANGALRARLPAASGENLADPIYLSLEGMNGTVEVWAAPGQTVNGGPTASFDVDGIVALWSNGVDAWAGIAQVPAESPGGEALDAEYVLGAAHASLPSGRVATDSTEIDAVLTTPNVISWVLNTASVVFAKLQDLTGLSVLGRAANSAGVMAAITATAARQVLRNNDAGTELAWGFPIEAQLDDVDIGDIHTLNVEVGRFSVAAGIGTLEKPTTIIDSQTGTLNAYVLPATLEHGDTLALLASTAAGITLNGISATGVPTGFEFIINYSDSGAGDGRLLVINDESGSATALDRLSLPADLQMRNPTGVSFIIRRASTRWIVVDRSFVEAQDDGVSAGFARTYNALSTTSNIATASVSSGVASLSYQRAALTGAVSAAQDSNATLFAGIRDNGAAETDRTNLNFVSSTSATAVVTDDAGNDELEVTFQRAALTGAVSASANSNATLFAGIRNNGAATTDRTNLNFINSTTTTAVLLDDSGSDEIEIAFTVNQTADYTWTGTHTFSELFVFSGGTFSATLAATSNNLAIGAVNRVAITLTGGQSLTGMVATTDGQWVYLENVDTTDALTVLHDSASSTAANRFFTPGAVDLIIPPMTGIWFRYNSTHSRWIVATKAFTGFNVRHGASFDTGVNTIEIISGAGIIATVSTTGTSPLREADITIELDSAVFATAAQQEAASSTTVAVSPGVQHRHPSAAKCWGFTTGGATPALGSPSYNVTSITDLTNARITVTIGTDFSSTGWVAVFSPGITTATPRILGHVSKAAGSINLESDDAAGADADPTGFDWAFFGDHT